MYPRLNMDEIWVIVQKKIVQMKNYENDGLWMWEYFHVDE